MPKGVYTHKKGRKCSEETKKKISAANKGRKLSEEMKKRISNTLKGSVPWISGKKHTEEAKRKMSISRKGRKVWNKGLVGVMPTPWNKGKKNIFSEEVLKKVRMGRLGKKHTQEWKDMMSKKMKENGNRPPVISGAKSHLWKGGITKVSYHIRTIWQYRQWRSDIFQRDNWTCQECGARCGLGKTIILEAHHIKPFSKILEENKIKTTEEAVACEELWNINNGITLCKECHNKTKKYER